MASFRSFQTYPTQRVQADTTLRLGKFGTQGGQFGRRTDSVGSTDSPSGNSRNRGGIHAVGDTTLVAYWRRPGRRSLIQAECGSNVPAKAEIVDQFEQYS
ncbi:MAG: hypothetical protein IPP22_16040 [Nitrosomonas sp.]|nr:hypothetical protein [Nitrosomonas sp.]